MLLMPLETVDPGMVQTPTLCAVQCCAGATPAPVGAGEAATCCTCLGRSSSWFSLVSGEGAALYFGGGPWGPPWGPLVLAHCLDHEDFGTICLYVQLAHSCSTNRKASPPLLRPLLVRTFCSRSFTMGPRTSCWRSCGFGPWPLLGPLSSGALLPAGGRHKGVGSRTPCSPRTHAGSGPGGRR